MDINELRIGNYYNWYAEGKYYAIRITAKDFLNENYKNFESIPITDEMQELIGKDKFVFVDKQGFVIFKNTYSYAFIWQDYLFLHDFQNLYKGITNTELVLSIE